MHYWHEEFVEVEEGSLRVLRTGGSKPPVVLLHGLLSSAGAWTRTGHVLRASYDVIAYDARGHGGSSRTGGQLSEDRRVADLLGVVRALRLEPVALVGHSMGAATAALFAARHPQLVRALVLEDPAFLELTPEQQAVRSQGLARFRELLGRLRAAPREEALQLARQANPHWSGEDLSVWLDSKRDVEWELFSLFDSPITVGWREYMRKVECPFLLLTGESERGGIVSTEQAEALVDGRAPAQAVRLPGTGHNLRFDDFPAFISTVQAFLRRHDSALG